MQPSTRSKGNCLRFTFGKVTCHPSVYTVNISHSNAAVKQTFKLNKWGVLLKTSFEHSKRWEVLQAEFLINVLSFRGYCLVPKLVLGLLKAAVVMRFRIAFTVSKWQFDSHSTAFIHEHFEKINLSLILFYVRAQNIYIHSFRLKDYPLTFRPTTTFLTSSKAADRSVKSTLWLYVLLYSFLIYISNVSYKVYRHSSDSEVVPKDFIIIY